jgi:hypothetical protein
MISIKLLGVSETLKTNDKEFIQTINQLNIAQALETLSALKAATPVDTGRAKNSWILTDKENRFIDGRLSVANTNLVGTASDTSITPLYITNGTPYIESLNEGSSKQAPARFVEQTVLSKNYNIEGVLFETINLDEL